MVNSANGSGFATDSSATARSQPLSESDTQTSTTSTSAGATSSKSRFNFSFSIPKTTAPSGPQSTTNSATNSEPSLFGTNSVPTTSTTTKFTFTKSTPVPFLRNKPLEAQPTSTSATNSGLSLFGTNPATTAASTVSNMSGVPITTPNATASTATGFSFGIPTSTSATNKPSIFMNKSNPVSATVTSTDSTGFGVPITTPTTATVSTATGFLFGIPTTKSGFGNNSIFGAQPTSTSAASDKPSISVPKSSPVDNTSTISSGFGVPITTASAGARLSFGIPATGFGNQSTYGAQPTTSANSVTTENTTSSPFLTFSAQPTITTEAWNAFHTLTASTTASSNIFTSSSAGNAQPNVTGLAYHKGTFLKFCPVQEYIYDSTINRKLLQTMASYQCIVAMETYKNKSLEELRLEDYIEGRNKRNVGSPNSSLFDFPTIFNRFSVLNTSDNPLFESNSSTLSANIIENVQKQIDRLVNVTEARFNEAYSQQIEQYLTMRNITELIVKIDKRLQDTESENKSNTNYERLLKRLEHCETNSKDQQAKLLNNENKLNKLYVEHEKLVDKSEQQEKKIVQYEAKIEELETKLAHLGV